jgi:hypothetical protein
LSGTSGATLCAQRFGDDYPQTADFLVLARSASGTQANAMTVWGKLQGTIDFGLGPLVGTSTRTDRTSVYLFQVVP